MTSALCLGAVFPFLIGPDSSAFPAKIYRRILLGAAVALYALAKLLEFCDEKIIRLDL
jgi:hypothetical protein